MTPDIGPVLFVTHQASRTGAPIVLLHLLRWLRANTDTDFEVLALRGGPLEPDYAESGALTVLRPESRSRPLDSIESGLSRLGRWGTADAVRRSRCRRLLHDRRFRVVYLNSAPTWRVARVLSRNHRPVVIGHAHELESGLQAAYPRNEPWESVAASMDLVIAAADSVADNLIGRHGLAAGRVHRHNAFIDTARTTTSPARVQEVRERLGLPSNARVIGAAGTVERRKGPDLFLALARELIRRRPRDPLYFLWLGGVAPDGCGDTLGGRMHHVRATDDPFPWLQLFDVFALTSREDPCPLVCLEAAWLGTPVVCFDGAGDIPGFVESGCSVPRLDIGAMATAVLRLLDDRALSGRVAQCAAAKVSCSYDVAVVAPRLVDDVARAVWAAAR